MTSSRRHESTYRAEARRSENFQSRARRTTPITSAVKKTLYIMRQHETRMLNSHLSGGVAARRVPCGENNTPPASIDIRKGETVSIIRSRYYELAAAARPVHSARKNCRGPMPGIRNQNFSNLALIPQCRHRQRPAEWYDPAGRLSNVDQIHSNSDADNRHHQSNKYRWLPLRCLGTLTPPQMRNGFQKPCTGNDVHQHTK